MTTSQISALAAVAAAFIALATLARSVREYILQGTQKRAEAFIAMQRRLDDDKRMVELLDLAQDDSERLADPADVTYQEKYQLVGYFEEVALMTNSRLIRPRVAWYMFGYYVLSIHRSKNFWSTIHREDLYWSVFNRFAEQMRRFEAAEARRRATKGPNAVARARRMRF